MFYNIYAGIGYVPLGNFVIGYLPHLVYSRPPTSHEVQGDR